MRTEREIQDAHDLIRGISQNHPHLMIGEDEQDILNIIGSTLCWILNHQNKAMSIVLNEMKNRVEQNGLVLHKIEDN